MLQWLALALATLGDTTQIEMILMGLHFKNVNNCLKTKIYSYLETSGSQSPNLNLNVVNFFQTSVNYTFVAA